MLHFDSRIEGQDIERQPIYALWHILYSYAGDNSKTGIEKLQTKLCDLYGFNKDGAAVLASISFSSDYGNLSAKAIRKILPYLKQGYKYSEACAFAGYRHSKKSLTKEEIDNKEYKNHIDELRKNSLRNPVVEKILNQMINVVNSLIDEYGKPDEIRIELARELKKSAKEREELSKAISAADKDNEEIKNLLKNEIGISSPSRNDILRYKLYRELRPIGYKAPYSNEYIRIEDLFSKEIDVEHIIPQAILFDDSFANKTLEYRDINIEKGSKTAIDFVKDKYGDAEVEKYIARIEKLRKGDKNNKISERKYQYLLMESKDIPDGFINRDLRDTQYIAKKAKELLENIVSSVVSTTGSVTARLREDWQLVDIMKELNFDKYEKLGLIYKEEKSGRITPKIKDWTKRNDHRHHAMDALTIAFTKRSFIQYLNNLNSRIDKSTEDIEHINLQDYELSDLSKEDRCKVIRAIERKELYRSKDGGHLRFNPPMPLNKFREEAKKHLENTLVSIKAKNKIVTKNVNVTKAKISVKKKTQLTPRGELHNETIYGSRNHYVTKLEKIGSNFNTNKINTVAKAVYREALLSRLAEYDYDPKKAFCGKNSLTKNPIYIDSLHTEKVPEEVKTVMFEKQYTIRKAVDKDLKIEKVIDKRIQSILSNRLKEYDNNKDKAFSNLDENPIYLDKERGITIKRVTVKGVNNAAALHNRHNHLGEICVDRDGFSDSDFVSTSNNHHVAIYRDEKGNYQENIVSFFEAVRRVSEGIPVIDTEYKKSEGWEFLFTMKSNEYFVFPNEETGFDPSEIDLMDESNYHIISPNLFRVQTISKVPYGNSIVRDYKFRHHLETTLTDNGTLKDITYKQYKSLAFIEGIVKVRINHIGKIVHVGEY